jgi:hypothetical protein
MFHIFKKIYHHKTSLPNTEQHYYCSHLMYLSFCFTDDRKLTNVRIPVGWSLMAWHSYLASQKLGINHTDAHDWIRRHTEGSIIHWTSTSYMNVLADGIGAAHTCQNWSMFLYTVLKCKLFCITLIFLQYNMKLSNKL